MEKRVSFYAKKMNYQDKSNLYLIVKRLIDPKMMGQDFKVIFAKNKKCDFSLAFK